jgi:hypothetical protein
MSSQDFHKVLVKDDILQTTDDIGYSVFKGGQNVTPASFGAVSQNTSAITFNVQVPSEQTVISRKVLLQSTIQITISNIVYPGYYLLNYGIFDGFSPFPIQQSMNTIQCTVNNNTVSTNLRDIQPYLNKVLSYRDDTLKNSACPTYPDAFGAYPGEADIPTASPFLPIYYPNSGWNNTSDKDYEPRGSFRLDSLTGNWATVGDGINVRTAVLTITVAEPLLISPWIYGNPKTNNQGIYGVQNLNFVFNVGNANRLFRWGSRSAFIAGTGALPAPAVYAPGTVTINSFTNSTLQFRFLTAHPSDLMSSRNVVPYLDMPRFLTTGQSAIASGASTTITSNTIQLNQIPDKLILMVRKPMGLQQPFDSDCFWTLDGDNAVSIQFNNNAGLLASASARQIWEMSVEAGNTQSWNEFSGVATVAYLDSAFTYPAVYPPGVVQDVDGLAIPANTNYQLGTAGSLIILDFGKHIQLVEDYYAPGSIGNFNLQVSLRMRYNNMIGWGSHTAFYNATVTPELCMVVVNSGVLVTEKGTSSTFTGILSKQDVLDASSQSAVNASTMERIVGGGFLDKIRSTVTKAIPYLAPLAKTALSQVNHPMAKVASAGLGALGYGKSGGKLAKHLM